MSKIGLDRLVAGAVAGLAGTLVMHPVRLLSKEYLPESMAPIRQDPGAFMVEQAEDLLPTDVAEQVPEWAENAAARSLAMGYGTTLGALYGAVRGSAGNALVDGTVLGLTSWAAGYLGWIPAVGLMPPVSEQPPARITGPILRHALFGVVTAAVYQELREHF